MVSKTKPTMVILVISECIIDAMQETGIMTFTTTNNVLFTNAFGENNGTISSMSISLAPKHTIENIIIETYPYSAGSPNLKKM